MRLSSIILLPPLLALSSAAFRNSLAPDRSLGAQRSNTCHRDDDRAESCGACHQAIYTEWRGTAHSQAWKDPIYQRALAQRQHPERCHSCHIPASVQRRLAKRPRSRTEHLAEGVTCVACHKGRDGMAGPLGTNTPAHATVKHPAFTVRGSFNLCASCHDTKIGPVLPVARDFVAAKLAAKGKSCVGCHMPTVSRPIAVDPQTGAPGPSRRGRRHRVLGPGDVTFCRKAFKIKVRREAEHLVLAIANRAGHRIPGLIGRKFPFIVEQVNADGARVVQHSVEISAENFLKVEETREFRFPVDRTIRSVIVRIRHQLGDLDTLLTEKSFPL